MRVIVVAFCEMLRAGPTWRHLCRCSVIACIKTSYSAYFEFAFKLEGNMAWCGPYPGVDVVGCLSRLFVGECEADTVGGVCAPVEFQIFRSEIFYGEKFFSFPEKMLMVLE